MAVSFSEETLRALQNVIQIHQAIPSTNATDITYTSLHPKGSYAHRQSFSHMVSSNVGGLHMALVVTVVDAIRVVGSLLDWRRRLGSRA